MQLTQKESSLLKDLKAQEELCIEKYSKHAQSAVDEQLRNLFQNIADAEKHHLEILCKIESGENISLGNSGNSTRPPETFSSKYGIGETPQKAADSYLCHDLLTMEKHASSLYDTCIFEFTQKDYRDALNEIQKDEQHHGKQLYDYMSANAMQA